MGGRMGDGAPLGFPEGFPPAPPGKPHWAEQLLQPKSGGKGFIPPPPQFWSRPLPRPLGRVRSLPPTGSYGAVGRPIGAPVTRQPLLPGAECLKGKGDQKGPLSGGFNKAFAGFLGQQSTQDRGLDWDWDDLEMGGASLLPESPKTPPPPPPPLNPSDSPQLPHWNQFLQFLQSQQQGSAEVGNARTPVKSPPLDQPANARQKPPDEASASTKPREPSPRRPRSRSPKGLRSKSHSRSPRRVAPPPADEDTRDELSEDEGIEDGGELDGDWVKTSKYLDSRKIYGLTVPVKVPPSQWSHAAKTAGMNPMDMLVHQFLFKGVKSFDFRHLANGKFTLIKVCRNVNEFHVVSAVLEVLRARGDEKVDCEVLISAHLKEKGEIPATEKVERKTQRKLALKGATHKVLEVWKKPQPNGDAMKLLQDEIATLQKQLAEAKNPAAAATATPPQPPPFQHQTLPGDRLSRYAKTVSQEIAYTGKTKVRDLTKTDVQRLAQLLELNRQEKMEVAGAVAELTDMATVSPSVSQLESTSMIKEAKKLLSQWGVPQSLLAGTLKVPALSAAFELLALASVTAARVIQK